MKSDNLTLKEHAELYSCNIEESVKLVFDNFIDGQRHVSFNMYNNLNEEAKKEFIDILVDIIDEESFINFINFIIERYYEIMEKVFKY